MLEKKVFKMYMAYRKNVNERYDHSVVFAEAESPETAGKLAKKLISRLNPGLNSIVVNNIFELSESERKEVLPSRILTQENQNYWIKSNSDPAKEPAKVETKTPLKNKIAQIFSKKTAAKPLTKLPWLLKKGDAKPVIRVAKKARETDWDVINSLPHNQDFDENN